MNYIEKQVEEFTNAFFRQQKDEHGSHVYYEIINEIPPHDKIIDDYRKSLTSLLEEIMEALPPETIEVPEVSGGYFKKLGYNRCRQQFLDNLNKKGLFKQSAVIDGVKVTYERNA